MDNFLGKLLLCLQFFLLFGSGLADNGPTVEVIISPKNATEGDTSAVDISCHVNGESFKDVVILELKKRSLKSPIAFIRAGSSFHLGPHNLSSRIENVQGAVNSKDSIYLNLTLTSPILSDSGEYRCELYYLDFLEEIKIVKSSSLLTVNPHLDPPTTENPPSKNESFGCHGYQKKNAYLQSMLYNLIDRLVSVETNDTNSPYWIISISDEERQMIQAMLSGNKFEQTNRTKVSPYMQTMTNRLARLEAYVSDLASREKPTTSNMNFNSTLEKGIVQRVQALETHDTNHSGILNRLENIESQKWQTVVFSSSLKPDQWYRLRNRVLRLPDVEVNIGHGFDSKTGIFTVPVSGVYSLHLTLLTLKKGTTNADVTISMEVNTTQLTKLEVVQNQNMSTISRIADLRAGDQVKIIASKTDGTILMYGGLMSRFSGYLIH